MGLYKRKNTYWMSFSYKGRQYQRSTGTTDKAIAQRIHDAVRGRIALGQWIPEEQAIEYTFDDLMEKFMKEHAPKREPATQRMYANSFKNLKQFFQGMPLSRITPKAITEYMHKRLDSGVSIATANRDFAALSKAMNLAWKRWEWCKENPCIKVQKEPENNKVLRWLSQEEEDRLMAAANGLIDGQLTEILTIALYTGMRQGEILDLKWENIDLFRKTILIRKSKNKEPRTIPMNQTVSRMLISMSKVMSMSGYVFTTQGRKMKFRNLMRAFYIALKKANIEKFRFHDLRHTFATRLVQAGVDLYSVAKLLGHKDIKTTQRYSHHSVESVRQYVTVLDNFSEKNDAEKEPQKLDFSANF